MPESEFRRVGEHVLSATQEHDPATLAERAVFSMKRFVAEHGLDNALGNALALAPLLDYQFPCVIKVGDTNFLITPVDESSLAPQALTAEQRSQSMAAARTRRAIDMILVANPSLTRAEAKAMYFDGQDRSRAKPVTGPRHAPTPGQKRWDARLSNIIERAAKRGKRLSWTNAHLQATAKLEKARKSKKAA